MKDYCDRCGQEAVAETIEGWCLCGGCESIYNNILNEPSEEKTMEEFQKEVEDKNEQQNNKLR
jgi:hypothetical protein